MTWSYCTACGGQLGYPTTEEIGDQRTMRDCGERNDPRVTLGELLQQIHDKLTEMEARMDQTEEDLRQLSDGTGVAI